MCQLANVLIDTKFAKLLKFGKLLIR